MNQSTLPPNQSQPAMPSSSFVAENDGVKRASIAFFCLFIVCALAPFVIIPNLGIRGFLIVMIILGIAAAIFIRDLPKLLLLLVVIGPPLAAAIYLAVCFRDIRRLPQPYKTLGFVGCGGFAVLLAWTLFAYLQQG